MNNETRSYIEIAAENTELIAEVQQLRGSTALLKIQLFDAQSAVSEYERAHAVAEAMAANNDVLRRVDDRTRVYRATGKVVEVDVEFGQHMFDAGFRLAATTRSLQRDLEGKFLAAIEAWKAK